jgi:metal-responsive CopG/Arc/MetJ family transcriptional regulator
MGTPNIVMSDELWNQLQQQAAKEEISASAIIRRLVREYLESIKQKKGG